MLASQENKEPEKCHLKVELLPLLRLLRPRLISSTVIQIPKLLRTLPKHPQARELQESAPDYRRLQAWSAHPERPAGRAVEDANHLQLVDEMAVPVKDRPCDCFYVHDSTLVPAICEPFDQPRWNAPMESPKELVEKINEQTDLRVAAGASAFNRLCRIYAPRYRQVNVLCVALYMPPSPVARWKHLRKAMDLAYEDLRDAFRHFLRSCGNRPFFIAGHSQGTMHLSRLLQEEVDPYPERVQRFVHAYLVGQTVPLSIFQDLRHVRASEQGEDVCSVSSWRTAPPGILVAVFQGLIFHVGRGWKPLKGEILAVNPITWQRGAGNVSQAEAFLGAAFPCCEGVDHWNPGWPVSGVALRFGCRARESKEVLGLRVKQLSRIDCGEVVAQVDRTGATRVPKLPTDCWFTLAEDDFLRYHDLDIALFFGNLRANARQRYDVWRRRSRL